MAGAPAARAQSVGCSLDASRGSTFRLISPANLSGHPGNGVVIIMSDEPATAIITLPAACAPVLPTPVSPVSPAIVRICEPGAHFGGCAADRTIVVQEASNLPVLRVIYKPNYDPPGAPADSSDDAYLALPTSIWSTEYWALAFHGYTFGRSRFHLLADGTNPTNVTIDSAGVSCAGLPASQPLAATTVCGYSCPLIADDSTAVHVTGTAPFGLIAGSFAAQNPIGANAAEALNEMMWGDDLSGPSGMEYHVTEFPKLNEPPVGGPGDIVRILSLEDFNSIGVDAIGAISLEFTSSRPCPVPPAAINLNRGQWCDLRIDQGARIYSLTSRKLRVAHYAWGSEISGTGDPTFVQVVPSGRMTCSARFFSFPGFDADANLNGSYVNIVAPTSEIANFRLDGVELPVACPGYLANLRQYPPPSQYSWVACPLPDPPTDGEQHAIGRVDAATIPVAAYVYAFRADRGAYAYPAGIGF